MSILVGVAGGTGSGKTSFASRLLEHLGAGRCLTIAQDSYYRDGSRLSPEERAAINYDHPDALEMDLLCEHLDALHAGQPVTRPTYDFSVHDRAPEGLRVEPAAIVIVEGILVLADERLRIGRRPRACQQYDQACRQRGRAPAQRRSFVHEQA